MATSRSSAGASAPRDSGRLLVDGHALYWERHGADGAPALALLHDGLGSTRSWARQIPAWAEAGWQIVVYDRWGYGRSDRRPSWPPDFLARDAGEALTLFDCLSLDRVRLVGHSDGGTLALMLAAAHPGRIPGMVLVAAHIEREPSTIEGVRRLHQAASTGGLDAYLRRHHGDKGPELALAWTRRWLDPAMDGLSLAPILGEVRCPTLVIQGELDEHATRRHAERIAEGIPDSELWLIPGVGHRPAQETPDAFNRRVLAFLGEPSASEPEGLVESLPSSIADSPKKDRGHA